MLTKSGIAPESIRQSSAQLTELSSQQSVSIAIGILLLIYVLFTLLSEPKYQTPIDTNYTPPSHSSTRYTLSDEYRVDEDELDSDEDEDLDIYDEIEPDDGYSDDYDQMEADDEDDWDSDDDDDGWDSEEYEDDWDY